MEVIKIRLQAQQRMSLFFSYLLMFPGSLLADVLTNRFIGGSTRCSEISECCSCRLHHHPGRGIIDTIQRSDIDSITSSNQSRLVLVHSIVEARSSRFVRVLIVRCEFHRVPTIQEMGNGCSTCLCRVREFTKLANFDYGFDFWCNGSFLECSY